MNRRDDEQVLIDLALRAGINFSWAPSEQWPQFILRSVRNKVRANFRRPWFTRFLLFFHKSRKVVLDSFGVQIVYKAMLDAVFFMSVENTPPFHPNCRCFLDISQIDANQVNNFSDAISSIERELSE